MHVAMRHPERGGVFYALRALSECRRQQGTQFEPEADPTRALGHGDLVKRAAWAELSLRRCAAFTADDLADGEVQRLLELGAARGDTLAGAYTGWLAAIEQGSIAALVPAMQRVLDRADPGLLEWVSVAGIDYLEGRRGAGGPLDDVARRRRMDAWALLPCEFGGDCTQPDLGAASPCVGAGRCEGGQRAQVMERGGWRSAGVEGGGAGAGCVGGAGVGQSVRADLARRSCCNWEERGSRRSERCPIISPAISDRSHVQSQRP